MSSDKVYIAIDLKSFYASVEYIERKLNPMTTRFVVADMSRTDNIDTVRPVSARHRGFCHAHHREMKYMKTAADHQTGGCFICSVNCNWVLQQTYTFERIVIELF